MGILDDFAAQYAGLAPPQFSADTTLANLGAWRYRPTPDATFPGAPAGAQPSLPIAPADPWIWLSPDGRVSYAGRQDAPPAAAPSDAAPTNNNPLNANALTLMALGSGIAQGGIGRGLQQAAAAVEADRNRQAQQVNLMQTYNALTGGGVPPQEARIAVSNPAAMRAVVTKYFGARSQQSAAPPLGPISPPGLPDGSRYSPSRGLWRAPDGALFHWHGQAVES